MKYLLILSCLLFASVGWSEDININDLVLSNKDGLLYEEFADIPFTGKVAGQEKGRINKGIKIGKWIEYWDNGQLLGKYNYKNGEHDGEQLEYYENGLISRKVNFKDGKLDGEYIKYYESGQLGIKRNYKDGKHDGEWLSYSENGQLIETFIYKNGEIIEP